MKRAFLLEIADIKIGLDYKPFIIAEMSGNHNQSSDRVLKIVEAATQSGVHALKLQTYTADTITLGINEEDFYINDPSSLWKGQSSHSLYRKACTHWEWYGELSKNAFNENGMTIHFF